MNEALRHRMLAAFRWVDLGEDATHEVSDTSGWWRDPVLLAALGPALAGLVAHTRPTVVIGPETSGFLLGPLVAQSLSIGFVEAYKNDRGHVADRMLRRTTTPDHRGREVTLSVRASRLSTTDRVLLVDDWTATGAQLVALHELVDEAGAGYAAAAVVVDGCPPATAARVNLVSLLTRRDLNGLD